MVRSEHLRTPCCQLKLEKEQEHEQINVSVSLQKHQLVVELVWVMDIGSL